MADTNSVAAATGLRSYEEYLAESRKPRQELGKSDFLSLLAAQLQYQDPMEPVKDTDFIAQLAQFSSLQQMENLTTTMTAFQYYSLTGKYVYAEITMEDGTTGSVQGVVQGVVQKDGKAYVQLPGYDFLVDASKISEVYDRDMVMGMGGSSLLETSSLIGRMVTAKMYDADGEALDNVSGVVTRVAVEKGGMAAYLDGSDTKKVSVSNIIDIQQVLDDTNGG